MYILVNLIGACCSGDCPLKIRLTPPQTAPPIVRLFFSSIAKYLSPRSFDFDVDRVSLDVPEHARVFFVLLYRQNSASPSPALCGDWRARRGENVLAPPLLKIKTINVTEFVHKKVQKHKAVCRVSRCSTLENHTTKQPRFKRNPGHGFGRRPFAQSMRFTLTDTTFIIIVVVQTTLASLGPT